jgi:hypothetical protein
MNSEEQFRYDNELKIFNFAPKDNSVDRQNPPMLLDYTKTEPKLHRKSIIVKGECVREEFYGDYNGTVYNDLVVKEETTFTRDTLGFPISKQVTITWYRNDGSACEIKKIWNKYYSGLEKIAEGEFRRSNLVAGLQEPMIG